MGRNTRGREPVEETCPAINSYIWTIREAIDEINACDIESERSVKYTLKSVGDTLNSLRNFLDDEMRYANSALRDWGRKEEDRVDTLENELHEAKQEVRTLESNLKDAEYDRDNAQAEADAANSELSKLRQEQGFLQDYLRTA